jgi:Ferritin-like domain
MPRLLSRSSFLAATALAVAAPTALADAPADADLASTRLLVAVELLLLDFYGRSRLPLAKRAAFNEREHLAAVSQILTDAGQTPLTAGDIDFTYPGGAFGSAGKTARLGWSLERLALGAYLGAVDSSVSPVYRNVFARIAANEAQHLDALRPFTNSFADVLTIERASDALSEYTG